MMRTIPFVFLVILLMAGCSKQKSCPDWYEGTNCETPMRQKWIGTFTGITHVNANVNGTPDTYIFIVDSTRIDYDYCFNKGFALSIRNTREASFNLGSGVGIISEDGKYVTLTYPVISYPNGAFDPRDTILYTFTGTKQ